MADAKTPPRQHEFDFCPWRFWRAAGAELQQAQLDWQVALAEAVAWTRRQLERARSRWQEGAGFSFSLEPGDGPDSAPGLQGTEMWLSIIWLSPSCVV